jgi:hypothetical protein
MTLSITTLSKMTVSIMSLSIMTPQQNDSITSEEYYICKKVLTIKNE